jgi:hypothetical protein
MGTSRLQPAAADYQADSTFKTRYQSLVGTLMYAMLGTRPDIAFAVSLVSRFASNPDKSHIQAVLRILSYLRGTLDLQLVLQGEIQALRRFTDSPRLPSLLTQQSFTPTIKVLLLLQKTLSITLEPSTLRSDITSFETKLQMEILSWNIYKQVDKWLMVSLRRCRKMYSMRSEMLWV